MAGRPRARRREQKGSPRCVACTGRIQIAPPGQRGHGMVLGRSGCWRTAGGRDDRSRPKTNSMLQGFEGQIDQRLGYSGAWRRCGTKRRGWRWSVPLVRRGDGRGGALDGAGGGEGQSNSHSAWGRLGRSGGGAVRPGGAGCSFMGGEWLGQGGGTVVARPCRVRHGHEPGWRRAGWGGTGPCLGGARVAWACCWRSGPGRARSGLLGVAR